MLTDTQGLWAPGGGGQVGWRGLSGSGGPELRKVCVDWAYRGLRGLGLALEALSASLTPPRHRLGRVAAWLKDLSTLEAELPP